MAKIQAFGNFIGGQWVESSSRETFNSANPASREVLGEFQKGNAKDVELAVKAAEKGFEEWSSTPAPRRGEVLFEVARVLRKEKQRLGELVTREMGKQLSEGLGDVQEAIDVFEYMAGEGRRLLGYTTPSELRNKFCMTTRRPVGIAGLITPWNFPIAIPAWKASAALICGNSIVLKPSSDTPLCAIELVKVMQKAGVPDNVVNLVTGSGEGVGNVIVRHPKIRCLSFTGHRDTGAWILANAGIKKVGLEMGGKNPIIVMDDADVELAVEGAVWGGFGTTGQRCTAASRVIVHEKIKNEFEEAFVEKTRKLKVGDGMTCDVGPLVNAAALEKTRKYVKLGKREGKLLSGGNALTRSTGFFHEPTIFTNVKWDARIAQEEIFGPVVSVIPVKGFDEAIRAANSIEYGLSTSIYTRDVNKAFLAIEKLDAGITYVNASTIGAEVHLPFGGVKSTGNGTREAGQEGIHEFSETKAVYVDYSGRLQRAQIDLESVPGSGKKGKTG